MELLGGGELEELLNRLRAKGVALRLVEGGLLEACPARALTAEDRAALIRFKPEIVARLQAARRADQADATPAPASRPDSAALGRLLTLPLDRFAREGQPLEVRVAWLDTTLWWVPTEREAERLVGEGIARGRIWTARELMDLLSLGLDRAKLRTIAEAKLAWGGEVVEVRPRPPEGRP